MQFILWHKAKEDIIYQVNILFPNFFPALKVQRINAGNIMTVKAVTHLASLALLYLREASHCQLIFLWGKQDLI